MKKYDKIFVPHFKACKAKYFDVNIHQRRDMLTYDMMKKRIQRKK